MAHPSSLETELDCGVDTDLTQDVASLRAVLSERAPSSCPVDHDREKSACGVVAELQVCLDKNIALQNLLHEKLKEIDDALVDNDEKLADLKGLTLDRSATKDGILTIWRVRKNDYFKDHRGQTPPSLCVLNSSHDYLGTAVLSTEHSWRYKKSTTADNKLLEGIRRQIIDHLTRPLQSNIRRTDDYTEKMQLRQQIQSISKRSTQHLLQEDITIDWSMLAYEQFGSSRTAINCELRWKGHTNPFINRRVWSKEEDKALIRLVKEYNSTNWGLIAAELGTNRTGFICLQRYQQSLNPSMFTRMFSNEEDDRLTEAVKIYGESKWRLVAAYVGGKTPSQCMHRWRNTISPDIKRGKWNWAEDQVLRSAVKQCGVGNWTKIASLVPGRTQAQVRERWVNCLDDKINKSDWTPEEDRKLKEICQRYSGSIPWSTVAREMVTRTDNMCLIRWQVVSDTSTIMRHKTESLTHRAAVMTSFYGRKRCRHQLSNTDIEEDMVPDDMKKRLKSLEDKLTQQKLRQSIISSFIEQTNPPVHSTASSSDELTSSATAPKATAATSNMASSESYVFPKGRFLVLPTIPAQSPPPCVEGGGTGVPPLIHVPSSQSLQGVYTQPTA